jgi:hypothetical protein
MKRTTAQVIQQRYWLLLIILGLTLQAGCSPFVLQAAPPAPMESVNIFFDNFPTSVGAKDQMMGSSLAGYAGGCLRSYAYLIAAGLKKRGLNADVAGTKPDPFLTQHRDPPPPVVLSRKDYDISIGATSVSGVSKTSSPYKLENGEVAMRLVLTYRPTNLVVWIGKANVDIDGCSAAADLVEPAGRTSVEKAAEKAVEAMVSANILKSPATGLIQR